MKDKLSKVKNLVKKYGLTGTIKKNDRIYLFQLYCADFDERENLCGIE